MLAEELRREAWAREFAADEWAVADLLVDATPAFARVEDEGRRVMTLTQVRSGRLEAQKWMGRSPSAISGLRGLALGRLPDREWGRQGIRAELDLKAQRVLICEPAVRELASQRGIWLDEKPDLDLARETVIAHELFHALRVGVKVSNRTAEEIAAHAFAREMMGLEVSPLWFDWIAVWERKGLSVAEVRELTKNVRITLW